MHLIIISLLFFNSASFFYFLRWPQIYLLIYWIINFCFWLLRKIRRVEDILPFLCSKKSRFSSLQSVIDFCIVQLETEVASNQGKKSLLYCSRTRVLFREMRKTWFWELEGKKVICRHVHISMSSVDLYPYCIWLPTIQ